MFEPKINSVILKISLITNFIFIITLLNSNKSEKMNISYKRCYMLENSNIRSIHLIITRFLMLFHGQNDFPKKNI